MFAPPREGLTVQAIAVVDHHLGRNCYVSIRKIGSETRKAMGEAEALYQLADVIDQTFPYPNSNRRGYRRIDCDVVE